MEDIDNTRDPNGQEDALAYSEDIFSVKYDDGSLLPNVISSIFFAPIRLVIRVMFYYMVLPYNMKANLWRSAVVVSGLCSVLIGIVSLAVRENMLIIIVCFAMMGASIIMVRRYAKVTPSNFEKRKIKLNSRTVTRICETIYDKLDNI